ncbi:DsbA family oxidoreductase [Parahaliea mediterranea]|uniref:DsbA family oxidoreductase n=1 Tax=Parahaliea mediterranea TaxID=651086 RepID=UPI000E2FC45B|nr:DsbA family oxidoreductase [Parahaliea mediterranea]
MTHTLHIDIYFDFICPWCLIGKRNLERALIQLRETHPEVEVRQRWKGVQLLPDLPPNGLPYRAFYLNRLGSEDAVRQRQLQVQEAAGRAGLTLNLSNIPRMPNTRMAHHLFQACSHREAAVERSNVLLERLFSAHFEECANLGDANLLQAAALECGFDRDTIAQALNDPAPFGSGASPAPSSVPSFVVDKHRLVSGAHPPDVLHQTLLQCIAAGAHQ